MKFKVFEDLNSFQLFLNLISEKTKQTNHTIKWFVAWCSTNIALLSSTDFEKIVNKQRRDCSRQVKTITSTSQTTSKPKKNWLTLPADQLPNANLVWHPLNVLQNRLISNIRLLNNSALDSTWLFPLRPINYLQQHSFWGAGSGRRLPYKMPP